MKIAIKRAGIAGTTLAYWLRRFGHEPVLFEEAPALRTGGYVIDFWGVGYDVAEKMGLVPALQTQGYRVGEWRLVDADGRRTGELHRAGGDYAAAFGRYETRLKDFIRGKQDGAKGFASAFAPETKLGIVVRDLATRLMAVPFLADAIVGDMRDDIALPDYERLA